MKRGRPIGSNIRKNIAEILLYLGKGYGYQIAKIYNQVFPECTREVIYYHLRKGTAIGEFILEEIALEKGSYSWGENVEKIYYSLGPHATPQGLTHVEKVVLDLKNRLAAVKKQEETEKKE